MAGRAIPEVCAALLAGLAVDAAALLAALAELVLAMELPEAVGTLLRAAWETDALAAAPAADLETELLVAEDIDAVALDAAVPEEVLALVMEEFLTPMLWDEEPIPLLPAPPAVFILGVKTRLPPPPNANLSCPMW